MNSYPPELLAQLAPVMFVSGLDPPVKAPQESPDATPSQQQTLDPFQVLSIRLREALMNQRKVAVWQPEKSKTFQVIIVDKDVRFPPRKLVPPDDPQYSHSHSPLSPLTPSSPLFPDGLIAPIWIRKHTTLVPSVFVMFMRIFEFPPNVMRSPLEGYETEKSRMEEERRRDAELAAEIALRKKGTNERNVKLTVVLMASRRLLDDPNLDYRLTFIRRQSGLDSRAALFVLSPVSTAELLDFVKSLQQALYEPALEYYTNHSKRVRRKRNRHSQATASYPNPAVVLANPNISRPLRPEGWTVRYEYKMACFAEFRGEDEVALKHYQDAYATLTIMFGSTAILPPRTKRWAEAKVLADCINIKIVKLYLYNNETALALSHHNSHIRQFSDFSRGWGIGEEIYEFWSWVARQYRVLAEMIDHGTRSGMVIPVHEPSANTALQNLQRSIALPDPDFARTLGINPSHALQHSGFYYYMAAKCTDMRRARFLAALEAENNNTPIALSPGFANEKKVDHLSLILELYTKAYELFKKYTVAPASPHQFTGRLTLWIAYRIAETHYESGKFDMADRFFERIAKTYRKEGWHALLKPLLATWYTCAQRMGNVELSIKLLIEMMGQDQAEDEDPSALEEDLLAVFQSTVPSSTHEALVFDFSGARPIFETDAIFWKPEVKVEEPAAFQLPIIAPSRTVMSSIPISSVEIHFSQVSNPLVVHHQADEQGSLEEAHSLLVLDLGFIDVESESFPEVKANLRWQPGKTLLLTGSLVSRKPVTLGISKLIFNIEKNSWKVKVPLELSGPRAESTSAPRWLRSLNPPRYVAIKRPDHNHAIVKPRPHLFNVSVVHREPAFLDEDYPIVIEVTNHDDRDLEINADLLLQPTDIDYAVNTISVNGETSTSLIRDIPFGILAPGVQASKTIHLVNSGTGGNRLLDISITGNSVRTPEESSDDEAEGEAEPTSPTQVDKTVFSETISIPTVAPFSVVSDVAYARSRRKWLGLASLETFDADNYDQRKGSEALINMQISCTGPWSVHIEHLSLEMMDSPEITVSESSIDLDDGNLFPEEYLPGDEFCVSCRAEIGVKDDGKNDEYLFPSPGKYIIKWKRVNHDGSHGSLSTTTVLLPSLSPPQDSLVALVDIPPIAKLHQPAYLTIVIRNYHPTRSANVTVQVEPEVNDGFVMAGLRSGRVPVLLPGSEETLEWAMIPLECGFQSIPRIRIFDRRKAVTGPASGVEEPAPDGFVGEPVQLVDIRRDERRQILEEAQEEGEEAISRILEQGVNLSSVLVLPA